MWQKQHKWFSEFVSLYIQSGFQHSKQGPLGRAEYYGVVSRRGLILEHQQQQRGQEPRTACVFGAAPAEHEGNCIPDHNVWFVFEMRAMRVIGLR